MNKQVVPENFSIRPEHIDANQFFMGAFGKMGIEVLANAIVRWCQMKGYWISMAKEEIQFACDANGANIAFLKNLVADGYVVMDKNERYCLTEEFIQHCYKAAPAQ